MAFVRIILYMHMGFRCSGQLGWTRTVGVALTLPLLMLTGCGEDANALLPVGTLNTKLIYGESGTQLGQFVYPRGMDVFEVDGHPRAAIVDKTARIQIMDLETGDILGAVHTPRWDRGKPTGITVAPSAIDANNRAVYVADTHEHRVLMYELPLPAMQVPVPTQPDLVFGSFGEAPGQFIYPTDVEVQTDESGVVSHLYVSEYGGNDRINRFRVDRSGDTIAVLHEYQIGTASEEIDGSDGPLALSRPQSIALWTNSAGAQELIVTDASHHRIGRVSLDGDLIAWIGEPMDTSDDAYRFPYGITLLDDGSMLIAEFGGNRIRCVDIESGDTLWRYGVAGRSIGQVAQPWDCGVIGDQLVVLDSGNSRVQICELPKGVSKIGHELNPLVRTGATP